ncbi:Bardet-Biedl syndrome 10 protein isoform X2 [Lepisosteus oculatus]
MKSAQSLDIGTLVQIAETLESIVSRCFGPNGGLVLFTKATGEVLLTRDGKKILHSLLLDHPVARVLVDCVSVHCSMTGDGAKSFILLLSALLRGLQASVEKGTGRQTTCHNSSGRGKQASQEVRRVANCLLTFQTQVLDGIIKQHLSQHVTSLFSNNGQTMSKDKMNLLMEAYFCGKTGNGDCRFLSQMACDYFFKCNCEQERDSGLNLICSQFLELHTAVTGLPVHCSRILEGLVLHRDFTVYCPADGHFKALVVTEPVQPSFSATGTTLYLRSESQLQSCYSWISNRVEEVITSLQQNQVKLILSSVKQSDLVIYHAKLRGISVLECVEGEELSVFCHFNGVLPLAACWDIPHIRQEHLADVTFCKPVLLGSRRYAHVGFQNKTDFNSHCLVLCGPVLGLTEQYVSAFQGAFRMLQQTCEPVGLWNSHRLHSKHSVRSAHKTSCSLKSSLKSGNDTAADRSSDCHDDQCPAIEELHCSSASVDDEKRMEGTVKREPRKLQSKRYDCSGPLNGTNISGHGSDENSQDSTESGSCPQQSRPTSDASNELTVQRKSVLFSDPVNNVLEKCCRITVGNFEAMGQVFNQKPPETLIEAGSILPVGGVFEFLLHHYLKLYSKQDVESDTKTACNIIADAVLNIPRSVYKEKGTNRQFLEVHTKFARDIKIKGQICGWLDFNESVSCKYQLLVSVLQCLHTLVSLDFLVHSSRRTRTGVECESEDSD